MEFHQIISLILVHTLFSRPGKPSTTPWSLLSVSCRDTILSYTKRFNQKFESSLRCITNPNPSSWSFHWSQIKKKPHNFLSLSHSYHLLNFINLTLFQARKLRSLQLSFCTPPTNAVLSSVPQPCKWVQPLSNWLVPEPILFVLMAPTISSCTSQRHTQVQTPSLQER